MANLTESSEWSSNIREISRTDKVVGGEDGPINVQATQLANRTQYLKELIENLVNFANTADNFLKLGPDGQLPTDLLPSNLLYASPVIEPGTYTQVTVNEYGVIVDGCNPSSAEELGLSDTVSEEQVVILVQGMLQSAFQNNMKHNIILQTTDNVIFTLEDTVIESSLVISCNGVIQAPVRDYSVSVDPISNKQIVTFVEVRQPSDVISAYYMKSFE